MARPTKLTQEVHDGIIQAIRAGNYIETASAYVGIEKKTLYNWMNRGRDELARVSKNPKHRVKKAEKPFVDFVQAVERALAHAEVRDVAIIGKAAEDNWQASAWRLERKFPDRWGRKDKMQADVNHSGEVDLKAQIQDMTDEELEQIASEYDVDE